jgi:anti-anti-sigma factor
MSAPEGTSAAAQLKPKMRLRVAATADGCCVKIEGRGTMGESPSAEAVAARTLAHEPSARVVFDLSGCDYLDSTFLGCIVRFYREHGKSTPPRFCVAAPPDRIRKLMGPCQLDRVIPIIPEAPEALGPWVDVPVCHLASGEMARHIMECHRLLAEVDGPMRDAFLRIAEQLQRELDAAAKTNPH